MYDTMGSSELLYRIRVIFIFLEFVDYLQLLKELTTNFYVVCDIKQNLSLEKIVCVCVFKLLQNYWACKD